MFDIETQGFIVGHFSRHDPDRFVGGVIQHVNFKTVFRIFLLRHAVNDALRHVHFIIHGQLYRYKRYLLVIGSILGIVDDRVFPVVTLIEV